MFNCIRPSSAKSGSAENLSRGIEEDANTFQPIHQGSAVGPMLQYYGQTPDQSSLVYSVLGVYPSHMAVEPTLQLSVSGPALSRAGAVAAPAPISAMAHVLMEGKPELLDTVNGYAFWRFLVAVTPDKNAAVRVSYVMSMLPPAEFHVPGLGTNWRYGFFSCNGYSLGIAKERLDRYKPSSPLWNDILQEKNQNGLHLLIGGGDQLYFDDLWNRVPYLKKWAGLSNNEERKNAPFSSEPATLSYYLDNYLVGFSAHGMREVLASVPSVMSWDDHDIFDGWGSYPDYLQESETFKGIFRCAFRLYLLFQQHASIQTLTARPQVGGFVAGANGGFSRVIQCGKHMACVLPDTRTERKLTQVLAEESWNRLFAALGGIEKTTRHILVLAPVPIIYPHSENQGVVKVVSRSAKFASNVLGSVESILGRSDGKSSLQNCGAFKSAVNLFNEPELLDDLMDHWTAGPHERERYSVLKRFQQYAEEQRVRITFLSGDVHLAAVGAIYTRKDQSPPINTSKGLAESWSLAFLKEAPATDHRLMFQFVSSAICNLPPPALVASSLLKTTVEVNLGDGISAQRMLDLFHLAPSGNSEEDVSNAFYLRRRNWGLGSMDSNKMTVSICAEMQKGEISGKTTRYTVTVPDLSK